MKPFHMARKILLPAVLLALAIGLAWKQTELAASLPADRVEILADGGASYLVPARAALEQAGADGEAFVATLETTVWYWPKSPCLRPSRPTPP